MIMENNNNGFTLIEVLTAILILTIGILGAGLMQNRAIEGNSTAIRLTNAVNWGGDIHETLMARPYTHADLTDANNDGAQGLDNTDGAGSPADGGPLVQGEFTVFWNVAENYPVFGNKTIRVIVRRSDKGQEKTVTLDFTRMEPI